MRVFLRLLLLNYYFRLDHRFRTLTFINRLNDVFYFVLPEIQKPVFVFSHVGDLIRKNLSVRFKHHILDEKGNRTRVHDHDVRAFHRLGTVQSFYRLEVKKI